jgi:hypothetical protein
MQLVTETATATLTADLPDESVKTRYQGKADDFVLAEEPGVIWLWAKPELLGWNSKVTFLFSPVVGNKKWPGDLWGIDEDRSLIVIENKTARGQTSDPLEDFLAFEIDKEHITDETRQRWERLYVKEMEFVREYRKDLETGTIKTKKAPGITPYSSKRRQTWRWRRLYLERIVPRIESPEYKRRVKELLSEKVNSVHFVGLFTVILCGRPKLSKKGVESYLRLKLKATAANVHLRAVEAKKIGKGRVEIVGRELKYTGGNT